MATENKATAKNAPAKPKAAPPAAPPAAPVAPAAAAPAAPLPPEKRGRGRPSNADRARAEGAEPVPPGSDAPALRNKKRSGKKPAMEMDKGLLAKQLQGLHLIAVNITGMRELALADAEAVMLSDAVVNVCEEYGLSISGKTGALIQLLAACGMVYLPRIALVKQRVLIAQQKKEAERVVNGSDHANAAATH